MEDWNSGLELSKLKVKNRISKKITEEPRKDKFLMREKKTDGIKERDIIKTNKNSIKPKMTMP